MLNLTWKVFLLGFLLGQNQEITNQINEKNLLIQRKEEEAKKLDGNSALFDINF